MLADKTDKAKKETPRRYSKSDIAIRAARAESLLNRIRSARVNFSYDPGGPANLLEAFAVIEKWIEDYYNGSYFGDIIAIPDDKLLAREIRR